MRNYISIFDEFVSTEKPCNPPMPLLHSCDAFSFRSIILSEKLLPAPCEVFNGELLVYFFYGRPAYRTSQGQIAIALPAFMPVSIVLKPDAIQTPKRIAPFDTGAFANGLFVRFMHPRMQMEDFMLSPTLDMPQRIVNYFYRSNFDYYWGKCLTKNIPPLQFEARSYYDLIREVGNMPFDDRCSTIEVQSKQCLRLTSDNVLLVVLPGVFLDDLKIKETICNTWRAHITTYMFHRGDPREYVGLVYAAVAEFLREKNYM